MSTGQQLRDQAIHNMAFTHEEWVAMAKLHLWRFVKRRKATGHRYFTTDDLWPGLETPREPRALAVVLRAAQAKNIIAPTDRFVNSTRKRAHAGPKRVWEIQP